MMARSPLVEAITLPDGFLLEDCLAIAEEASSQTPGGEVETTSEFTIPLVVSFLPVARSFFVFSSFGTTLPSTTSLLSRFFRESSLLLSILDLDSDQLVD
jgi:hypothetical protein